MTTPAVINIKAQSTGYDLPAPEYGYEVEIGTALIHTERLPWGYGIWDNGVANVSRTLKATWLLDATDTNTLLGIFNDLNKGRGISVELKLGTEPTGFYPFGPDHGDEGDFDCRMINIDIKPVMEEPWQYFKTEISFVEEDNPTYSLPSEVSEGDLQIGTITNLRYPPSMPQSRTRYGFSTQLAYDGTPYTIDKRSTWDYNATTLKMACNQSKAAALIDHLINTVRNNNLTIVAQSGNYLFGQPGGESGSYTCQWLDSVISIKHTMYDRFEFDLNFIGYIA
jgi:hypothetical protein